MSRSKQDTRYAAKRRAANRKRVRDLGKNIFVYLFIGILIIGTASTVFLVTTPATTSTVPGSTTNPTPDPNNSFASLLPQADQALASGVYTQAIGYYSAYASQNPQDADVLFKLGKAYVDPKNPSPNYLAGVDYLQRAVNINSSASWASEASSLINQYVGKAIADVTATALISGTAATGITATVPAGTPAITSTTVITK